MLFHIVEDCFVIIRTRGVFRQAKVFARHDCLYAGVGSGFVRLCSDGSKTVPTMMWEAVTDHPEVSISARSPPRYLAPPVDQPRIAQ